MQRVACLWLALAAIAPAVAAQTPPPPAGGARPSATAGRIAWIRSQEILRAAPEFAVAESTLQKEIESFRAEIQKLQQQFDSALSAFEQQSIALSPAARQTKQRELQQLQQRSQQRSGELEERVNTRQRELFAPINSRIRAIIEGIRAEDNYAMIMDVDAGGGFVVAADPTMNITARVIQRLVGTQ
jgi:outer membrane protein